MYYAKDISVIENKVHTIQEIVKEYLNIILNQNDENSEPITL